MSEKMEEPKNIPHNWDYQSEFHTVTCGGCSFRYGAEHPDSDGWWTCPNCSNGNNPARASSPAQEPAACAHMTYETIEVAFDGWRKTLTVVDRPSNQEIFSQGYVAGRNAKEAIPALPQPGLEWREWRQIETAPKNGTFVDLLFRGNVRIADCIWYRDAWWATEQRDPSVCVSHGLAQPTHWMPIPTPAALTGEPK